MLPKQMMRLLLLSSLALCAALTGCSTVQTKYVANPIDIPTTLRVCRAAPHSPSEETQRAAAKYINNLAGAYLDCREKLSAVVTIIDRTNAMPR